MSLESYNSHCRKYRSTLDYILLPNCLLVKIALAKTFELHVDNTSDHLLILLKLCLPRMIISHGKHRFFQAKQRIVWSKCSKKTIDDKYVVPLTSDPANINMQEFSDTIVATDKITNLLLNCSTSLVSVNSG